MMVITYAVLTPQGLGYDRHIVSLFMGIWAVLVFHSYGVVMSVL